jgi:hypothetical protein
MPLLVMGEIVVIVSAMIVCVYGSTKCAEERVNKSTLELTPLSPSSSYRLISKRGALRHRQQFLKNAQGPLSRSEHIQPHEPLHVNHAGDHPMIVFLAILRYTKVPLALYSPWIPPTTCPSPCLQVSCLVLWPLCITPVPTDKISLDMSRLSCYFPTSIRLQF